MRFLEWEVQVDSGQDLAVGATDRRGAVDGVPFHIGRAGFSGCGVLPSVVGDSRSRVLG
jgi:hypothetical protein